MEPADKHREGESVPEGGEPHPILLLFAPFGDDWREGIDYPQVPFFICFTAYMQLVTPSEVAMADVPPDLHAWKKIYSALRENIFA